MTDEAMAALAAQQHSLWWLMLDAMLIPSLMFVLILGVYWTWGRINWRFIRKQSDHLDHQRDVSERALDQSKAFEDMIARHYADSNARSDQALAQSADAMRLHAAALEQLVALNAKLERIAASIDPAQGRTAQ